MRIELSKPTNFFCMHCILLAYVIKFNPSSEWCEHGSVIRMGYPLFMFTKSKTALIVIKVSGRVSVCVRVVFECVESKTDNIFIRRIHNRNEMKRNEKRMLRSANLLWPVSQFCWCSTCAHTYTVFHCEQVLKFWVAQY